MKKLFLLSFSLAAFAANAQGNILETDNITANIVTTQGDEFNVVAGKMVHDNDTQTVTYTDVKSLKTDLVEVCYADKIVFNIETNELILSGNLSMTGVSMHMDGDRKHNYIRYKIGDTVAYME